MRVSAQGGSRRSCEVGRFIHYASNYTSARESNEVLPDSHVMV